MDFKRITTNRPLMCHFKPNECYYWINDDGKLCIAMQRRSGRLLGNWFRREFLLSMVLGEPPTGDARTYFGHRRTLRALNHRGLAHDRYASFRGATGVWGYGTGTLNGRFRFTVKGQSYLVLTDWASDRLELLTGAFTAVENRTAGERIFAKTEAQGLARPAPPRKRSEKKQEHRRPASR